MSTILCRVGFCEKCFRAGRPLVSQAFLAYGSTRDDYVTYRSQKNCHYLDKGFTPHILQLTKTDDTNVYYRFACSMEHCDVTKVLKGNVYQYDIIEKNWKYGYMPIKSWNAMVAFKDSGYQI